MHRVLILGIDGYIGYPLALHLLGLGHEVFDDSRVEYGLRLEETRARIRFPLHLQHLRFNGFHGR